MADKTTRIGVIGAGAIGGYTGGMIARAGYDVTLADQWPEHVDAIQENGLRITTPDAEYTVDVKALHLHQLQSVDEPFDYAFVAVKSYDTEWAATMMLRYVKPGGAFVDFQNGINDLRLAEVVGAENALGAVITIGAGMYEPGHVERTDRNAIGYKIGEHDGADTPRLRELVEIVSEAGTTQATDNLWGERWAKLAVNCMANPVAGITGLGSGEVRSDIRVRRVGIQVAAEVIRVGRALGYEVGSLFGMEPDGFLEAAEGRNIEEFETRLREATQGVAGGRPSFLQDVMKHRRTEIDFLNGHVSEEGRTVGVPTPFCDALVKVVHDAGIGRLEPNVEQIEPVAALLPF